jgi:hypothetical protein
MAFVSQRKTKAMSSDRRESHDALAPVNATRWLTVRTMWGMLLEYRVLPPNAEMRAVLTNELNRLRAEGWRIDEEHSSKCAAFFAQSGPDRIGVAIERYDPTQPAPLDNSRSPG